jgi:mRNA-degrading endonuclease RelE of RelBE toxin-antitoxin system
MVNNDMKFIETSIFTKQVTEILTDDDYRRFQEALIINPTAGDLIQHSGGLRKVRWAIRANQGKRGGARVIYYWQDRSDTIFLLLMYSKGEQENLTPAQLKVLKQIMETMKNEK